jgi:cytidylate kinase
MKKHLHEKLSPTAVAERQMQAWSFANEIADRALSVHGPHSTPMSLGPHISISREVGAGAEEVARRVAETLGWEVMDRNILDEVASRFHLSKSRLELVDETTSNWVYDVLGVWVDRQLIPHEKYLVGLAQVVLAAARRGNVVFVGRGAPFLLPRNHGLTVRIIADEKHRIAQVMQSQQLDEAAARRHVSEVDRGRREFVQQYFRRDADDPHLYDLVLRTDQLGVELAADLVVVAQQRLASQQRVEKGTGSEPTRESQ